MVTYLVAIEVPRVRFPVIVLFFVTTVVEEESGPAEELYEAQALRVRAPSGRTPAPGVALSAPTSFLNSR